MIQLEMYLGGELFDAVPLGCSELSASYQPQINRLKEELLKKHQSILLKAACKPCFVLSGVPSCINNFVPLGSSRS